MSEERPRLYISVDRLAVMTIDENGGTMGQRSLWLAMEDLAFKNSGKYPGKSFVIDQVKLGQKAGMHFSSVKRISKHFEGLGLVSIKRRKKIKSCEYDRNFYTLHYPKQPIDHSDLRNHGSCNNLDIQLGMASMPPVPSPLALRGLDAMPEKQQSVAVDPVAKAELATEQLAVAEERRRQEEAELAERQERERIEKEQRLERLRLAEEKRKADEEAAKLAQDARRLAMRTDVAACRWAIVKAKFDEWDCGSLGFDVLRNFNRSTFDAAVDKLLPDFPNVFDKIKALIKNCPWEFE